MTPLETLRERCRALSQYQVAEELVAAGMWRSRPSAHRQVVRWLGGHHVPLPEVEERLAKVLASLPSPEEVVLTATCRVCLRDFPIVNRRRLRHQTHLCGSECLDLWSHLRYFLDEHTLQRHKRYMAQRFLSGGAEPNQRRWARRYLAGEAAQRTNGPITDQQRNRISRFVDLRGPEDEESRLLLGLLERRHGHGGYRAGCRCDVCRDAARMYVAKQRTRGRADVVVCECGTPVVRGRGEKIHRRLMHHGVEVAS